MTPAVSVVLVETFSEDVWATCNPDAIDAFVADHFIVTTAGVDVIGPEDFKAWVAGFQATIAELKWETIETIETFTNADGSRVASRFRVSGRNNGKFGLPADGKPVAYMGTANLAVTPAGKLARNWVERSALELYNQLKGLSLDDASTQRSGTLSDLAEPLGEVHCDDIPSGVLPNGLADGSPQWEPVRAMPRGHQSGGERYIVDQPLNLDRSPGTEVGG